MISKLDKAFWLETSTSSYVIFINEIGKPILLYYGKRIEKQEDVSFLLEKDGPGFGRSTIYDEKAAPNLTLNDINCEFSLPLKGDYQNPSLLLESEKGLVYDFVYEDYEIISEPKAIEGLPTPRGGEELVLYLSDKAMGVYLDLHYRVYEEGVIGRYVSLRNEAKEDLIIRKASSYQVCLLNKHFNLESFYGGWAGEFQKEVTPIGHMGYFLHNDTGSSTDFRNPFFLLKSEGSSLHQGEVYGFNLIYSGNHRAEIEENRSNRIRVNAGISPQNFGIALKTNETFVSPVGLLAYSEHGENGITAIFHSFIKGRVLPSSHKDELRPIVYNNWEGTYFKFNEGKLSRLISSAHKLGIELFVLDDGWFGKRNADNCSLGDYSIDKKKLPRGLRSIAKKVHKKGMLFGLWFEPEAISIDSDLYRAHPDWAIQDGIHSPSLGRHQLVLDLTKKEVRDYIYGNLYRIISENQIDFIKWDYNRCMSDLPGDNAFYHHYILGLYEILGKLREAFPSLWMENCASGGGRNDLGMMSYFDTCWVSDDTDSFERGEIQANMISGYPQCMMSNHVAGKTSHQLIRKTSLGTKFDVASFGVLGYELNLLDLTPLDKKEIKAQIEFYKAHRRVAQFGTYALLEEMEMKSPRISELYNEEEALLLYQNAIASSSPLTRRLSLVGIDENATYAYAVRPEKIALSKFGSLINMVSPIHIKEEGRLVQLVEDYFALDGEKYEGLVKGDALKEGALQLGPEWAGTGLGENVRILGDFGARLYTFKKQ